MEDMNILVVDDQENNRQVLIHGLVKHGLPKEKIFESASGEEAEQMVQSKPGFFDVAVIDQKLGTGAMDGIESTRRICSYEREIFPIIFTNVPSDDPDTIESYRSQAYEAGAYRYMYREGLSDDIIKVKDFVSEIRQLRQLKERMQKFYELQQFSPSLLTQLDIMVVLVDRGFKVWYMNAAAKKFQDMKELPRVTCSRSFLGNRKTPPCSGCIVARTFRSGKKHERIYLHPYEGLNKKLKWVYSWTQPMPDENGKPILLEDRKPIAVLESSQDLTNSYRLRTMPLDERLHHIVLALYERPDGFDRVRIYRANHEGNRLDMAAHVGYPIDLGRPRIELTDFPKIQKSINHFKRTGEGIFYNEPGNKDPVFPQDFLERLIHWPLMKGARLVGLLSVSSTRNGRPCTEDGLDIVKGYAEEALKAFISGDREEQIPEIEKIASEIDNLIIRGGTPETKLQKLIDEVQRLTVSDSLHIRYREENTARLLPLGKGNYYKVAPVELPLSNRTTPVVRVIISGREEVNNQARLDPEVIAFRQSLPKQAEKILKNIESYCFEPLIFQNRCIGTLALYCKYPGHYDEKRIAIARVAADRLALVLHDYLVNIERMIKDYAFDSSINAVVFTDLDGTVNYVNKSFLGLLGYEYDKEVLRRHFREFCAHESEAAEVLRSVTGTGSWRGELTGKRQDGTNFDVSLSASLVMDRSGKAMGAMASFINITERKQLERVQKSIYRISETAGTVKKLDDLYREIHEIISELIPAKNFYIALYDGERQTIDFPYFIDEKDTAPPARKAGHGLTEYLIRTRIPMLVTASGINELSQRGEIEKVGTTAIDWLGIPLITTDEKTIGVLAVQTYEEALRYSEKDKEMLVFVSRQVAMAIERKRAEEQIKASLQEKEILLKEIHHRVKNNLAIISELFELQSGAVQTQQYHDLLESSKNRIKSMALIHETLYQSEHFSEIDSAEYIDNLINHLTMAFTGRGKPIEFKVEVENIPMDIDTAIPCGLIINELVTNAVKHAFPNNETGEISIVLRSGPEGQVTLEVADNGIGLPQHVDIEKVSSIGLQLVDILARQLDATIDIQRSNGTRYIISFGPLPKE